MKSSHFEFRFRVVIIFALYLLGFFAPWERWMATASSLRLWSWLAIEAARTNLLSVGTAYLVVTVAAVAFAILGAALRVWGTAYLGNSVMRNRTMQAGGVMAAGPYRHLRNPLSVGLLLNSFAVAILMPVTGALVFLLGMTVLTVRLIGGEEAFLTAQLGDAFREYRKAVPSVLPRWRSGLPVSTEKPRWVQSLMAEVYPVGSALCFAVLAWSYDANLLTRCLLVCFGIHLIARALSRPKRESAQAA